MTHTERHSGECRGPQDARSSEVRCLSAGQAVAVSHVAAHDLGAAAYAIRASACIPADDAAHAGAKDLSKIDQPDLRSRS